MIADQSLPSRLKEAKERAEIRDTDGVLLGYFTPTDEEQLYRSAAERFDPKEIQRIKQQEGHLQGRSTQEVLKRLRSLEAK